MSNKKVFINSKVSTEELIAKFKEVYQRAHLKPFDAEIKYEKGWFISEPGWVPDGHATRQSGFSRRIEFLSEIAEKQKTNITWAESVGLSPSEKKLK